MNSCSRESPTIKSACVAPPKHGTALKAPGQPPVSVTHGGKCCKRSRLRAAWETKSKRSHVQVFSLLHQPTAICNTCPCSILAPEQSRAVILQHTRLLKTPEPPQSPVWRRSAAPQGGETSHSSVKAQCLYVLPCFERLKSAACPRGR